MAGDVLAAVAELLHKKEITDLLTKQFLYVDERRWDLLRAEIFVPEGRINLDNGEGPRPTPVEDVVAGWEMTLNPLDAVYHQVGNYLITLTGENMAHAMSYGSATHFKAIATRGRTRTFVGLYEFDLAYNMALGWRISGMKFTLKFMDGNATLE